MILDFFEGKLDGDSWEDICQGLQMTKLMF